MPRGGGGRGRGGRGSWYGRGGRGGGGGICHQYRDTGTCRFGSSCRFRHVGPAAGNAGGAVRICRSSDDTKRFIQHLSVLPVKKLGPELFKSSALWRRCWQEHKALDDRTRRMMLEVLAKTPGSSSIEPPPIQLCEEVVKGFFATKSVNDEALLTDVKTVADCLSRLLQFEWDASREEVKGGLSNIVILAESQLKKQYKDHRDVAGRLMATLEDLEKPWRIKLKELSQMEAESNVDAVTSSLSYADWESATVKWLCTPAFFAPSCCPVMKVGQAGVYESEEEYMDCIHKLWVAMTFSDGHAALAPHCRCRGPSGSCNNALWPIVATGSENVANISCRTRGCPRPVEFACRIKSHEALCGDCASRSITHHLKGPGPSASTHVYDCKVKTIDSDGKVYLSEFCSRNPPPNVIHWRTTKRLSPPNLVGLVRVRSKGAPLGENDLIKWGEVAYHGHFRDEDKRRKNGELAVNLSSIVDFDPDFFEEGSQVAVIDCMSFVPEWIPVLRALESQRQARLPFDNGRHLNLLKSRPVISNSVVDDPLSVDTILSAERAALIEGLIDESQLEPIREIKRDDSLRNELAVALDTLVRQTTLDTMQLISFVDSLRNPVHLTQGPPGTGKSYLGVVMVRALMIIRDLWVRKSRSTGTPPILVLSYKNHAIDEFLVDLVNAEARSLPRDKLIRIGGKCNDARLLQYSESSFFSSDQEIKVCRSRLEKLNHLRESIQVTLSGSLASFLSYQTLMFDEEDEQKRRKAAVDATGILMETIVRQHLLEASANSFDEEVAPSPAKTIGLLDFLEVDSNRLSGRKVMKGVQNSNGSQFVALLVEGYAHYGSSHWGDVLLSWLCGKVPLPQCGYSESCTELSVSPEAPLCDDHRCHFQLDTSRRCCTPCSDTKTAFCLEHSCQSPGCTLGMEPGQKYCRTHCCQHCISKGVPSKMATDRPPRNVCDEHPLCVSPSCLQLCSGGSIYCEDHNVIRCMAITKKGRPCKGNPQSRSVPFCHDHKHLATTSMFLLETTSVDSDDSSLSGKGPEAFSAPQEIVISLCDSLRKDGKRCRGVRVPGSHYCYDHLPPQRTPANINPKDSEEQAVAPIRIDEVIATPDNAKTTTIISEQKEPPASITDDIMSMDSTSSSGSFEVISSADDVKVAADDDEIEIEEEENLRHLREVFEIQDDAGLEDALLSEARNQPDERLPDSADIFVSNDASTELVRADPDEWTWDMPLESRWEACHSLTEELRKMLTEASLHVKNAILKARKEFQQATVRAKARIYENKSVIGGTMVGCISRLESIRATRPFAIVVEEASEVLEPLLFSCLSEYTLKLEMIGDHRQLRPSVMSRYDFELCNKINVSMFQRLIEAPAGHNVPSTVLSIQRRMRKNICDLTREYYADVIEIEDHQSCGLQVIGQKNSTPTGNTALTSLTGGREVPGVGPHVFLWTHRGEQKRAHVGISRINPQEAQMVCALASYLVDCGVPRSSIAVLTPYKGQLMLIRDMLFKDARFQSRRLLSKDPQNADVCRISTVDRFQGDEEDIVICSLVVDEHSKTAFVKLVNRMIVLLSRARLGMYILGNISYFEQHGIPKHWANTLELLQQSGTNDTTGHAVQQIDLYEGVRSGPEIPLCCPVHRNISRLASSPADLQTGFCTEICQVPLPCSHPCSRLCHWPQPAHNSRCQVSLESPCSRHIGTIPCHQAYRHSTGAPLGTVHDNVMEYYKCPEVVDLTLPCGHVVQIPCWEEVEIVSGRRPWPVCDEPSPTPYTFSSCGHSRDVTCSELEKFTDKPESVRCEQDAVYDPPCGHPYTMKCWKREEFVSGSRVFSCGRKEDVCLPRCGHKHSLRCGTARKVAEWTGKSCEEVGKVLEGESYGPQEFPCREQVSLVLRCGHSLKFACSVAFARSSTPHVCREKVKTRHPGCGHPCLLDCADAASLKDVPIPDPVDLFREGDASLLPFVKSHIPNCTEKIRLSRKCGHNEPIMCSEVGKPLSGCAAKVDAVSALCGHKVEVECHLKDAFEVNVWSYIAFASVCGDNCIPQGAELCVDLNSLDPEMRKSFNSCRGSISVTQKCGHERTVKCSELLAFLASSSDKTCVVPVPVSLTCGHEVIAKCRESKRYEEGIVPAIKCTAKKPQKCWNYVLCQRTLEVDCAFDGSVTCDGVSTWTCPAKKHSYEVKLCSHGEPLDCPGCNMDELSSFIDTHGLTDEELRLHFGVFPNYRPTEDSGLVSKFLKLEGELLSQHQKQLQAMPTWDRTRLFLNECHVSESYRALIDLWIALTRRSS